MSFSGGEKCADEASQKEVIGVLNTYFNTAAAQAALTCRQQTACEHNADRCKKDVSLKPLYTVILLPLFNRRILLGATFLLINYISAFLWILRVH